MQQAEGTEAKKRKYSDRAAHLVLTFQIALTRQAWGQRGKSPRGMLPAAPAHRWLHHARGWNRASDNFINSNKVLVGMDPSTLRARSALQWVVLFLFVNPPPLHFIHLQWIHCLSFTCGCFTVNFLVPNSALQNCKNFAELANLQELSFN